MAVLKVDQIFPIFNDANGAPLEDGFVYIGSTGTNPEVLANQISIFWDEALSTPAAQPARTIGGYFSNSGTPGMIYIDGTDYSITVRDKNGNLVFSNLSDSADPATGGAITVTTSTGTDQPLAEALDDRSAIQSANITVNIPTDYATIQAAFDDLSTISIKHGASITVMIETGHILTQALFLDGGDYSQFIISSVDAEVLINTPSNVQFFRFTNCNAPTINVMLNGNSEVDELYRYTTARGIINSGFGGKNTTGRILYSNNTQLRAGGTVWDNYEEIFCTAGSGVTLGNAVMKNATRAGVVFAEGSTGDAVSSDIQDCNIGIHVKDGAVIDAEFAVIQRSVEEAVRIDDAHITLDRAELLDCNAESINMIAGTCRAPGITISSLSGGSSVTIRGGCLFSGHGTITGNGGGTGLESRGGIAEFTGTITGFINGGTASEGGRLVCRGGVYTGNSGDDIRILHGSWISAGGCETSSSSGSGNFPDTADTNVGTFNALSGNQGIIWA